MAYAWDPSKTDSDIDLSNSNRTLHPNSSGEGLTSISDWSVGSGKIYWEIEIDYIGTQYCSFGICDQGAGSNFAVGDRVGWDESWAYYDASYTGRAYHDGSYELYAGTLAAGDVLMFALDMDNHKLFVGKNGSWLNDSDPEAGTDPMFEDSTITGTISACVSLRYSSTYYDQITSCFKSSEFNYSAPSGYSAVDGGGSGATEPDISSEGLGLGETVGRNIEKTRGITAGLGFNESVDGSQEGLTEEGLSDGLAIGETIGRNVERVRGITAGLGFNGVTSTAQETESPVNAGLGLGETIGVSIELSRGFSDGLSFGESAGAFNYSAWLRANKPLATYRYYSKITGGADGLSDYPIPGLKSFQFRMRSGDPSYLSLVFVYTTALLSAISARENGEIVLDMVAVVNGEESLREELIRAPFYSVRYDRGAKSQSLTLVGYQTREYGGARVDLENVTTETMLADGRMQFRCARPDFYLRPGDTAVHGAHEITVGQITSSVAANSQMMDVSE